MKKIINTLILSTLATFALTVGEVPKALTLENENGGYLDGKAWSSSMIKNKVHVLFYVDPDEKDTNNEFSEALKAKNYNREKFASIAIVNLKATWLPNFVLESKLKEKQEKYPHTIYVKDKAKILVKEWKLKDDSSDILIFNQEGVLVYTYEGKLDASEVEKVLTLLDKIIK